ncbi:hypothetical protein N836_34530 [Leptolyngbya sp. Heron Island J]|nr:hypothetical protein N836_34530 [Leptolyngbya sp. Heron Island J]
MELLLVVGNKKKAVIWTEQMRQRLARFSAVARATQALADQSCFVMER